MSLRSHIAAAATLTLLGASRCWAGPVALVANVDAIYSVDLATRQAVHVGDTGFYGGLPVAVEGLAYGPDGKLYAATDNLKSLFRVAPQTAASSFVGSLAISGVSTGTNIDPAFAITVDGRGWIASWAQNKLWQVDLSTGATTLVGTLGFKITGLAARGNELFGAGSRGDEGLYRISTQDGHATLINGFKSKIPYAASINLAFDQQNSLWAVVNYIPPQNDNDVLPTWSDVAVIDPGTGTLVLQGPLTGPRELERNPLQGFAIAPPHGGIVAAEAIPATTPLGTVVLGALLALAAIFQRRRFAR
jgi:hypothetical protein